MVTSRNIHTGFETVSYSLAEVEILKIIKVSCAAHLKLQYFTFSKTLKGHPRNHQLFVMINIFSQRQAN